MQVVREWWRWLGWQRALGIAVATPVVAAAMWWMVRLPAPPIERSIPVASSIAADIAINGNSPGSNSTGSNSSGSNSTANDSGLAPLDTLAPTRIAVHVVGAVHQPGVYHLPSTARADDAVRAAGGATTGADLRRVNLAAMLSDGAQLWIPRVGERAPNTSLPSGPPSQGNSTGNSASSPAPPLMVDLNNATVAQLDQLPGVGPSTARAIVDHRSRNGPFAKVDDLLAVRGIGPAKLAELRAFVRV